MALRSKAHETFSLLFARDSVLVACICDNAEEIIQGKFYHKLKVAPCYFKQLEIYNPCLNAAEKELKELKKRASQVAVVKSIKLLMG